MSRMVVLAVAAMLVACGATTPITPTTPLPGGDDGVATAEGLRGSLGRIEPDGCPGYLVVKELAAGKGWTKMEAAFESGKGQAYYCGAVTFSVTPDADLTNPRFSLNQVIVSGDPGQYFLTASAFGKPVTVKMLIK